MKEYACKTLMLLLLVCSSQFQALANTEPVPTTEKEMVIDSISKILEQNYVFPDKAKEMALFLQKRFKEGRYSSIENPDAFAEALTKDLYSISQDGHLRVMFNPQGPTTGDELNNNNSSDNDMVKRLELDNFGFHEIKILEGNVGYVDLRLFFTPEHAGNTAVAAMNFLSNTDAIIFDLRRNRGGSPKMIQLLQSYLFGEEPVHLNDFYFRPTNDTTQNWTLPYVTGKRMPDIDVYILTSNRTFSAGEEFTYNLKNLERATIIGETTGGGAHPGSIQRITENYEMFIPVGRAINPITQTNWEGVGVKPHIEIAEENALLSAHIIAVEKLMTNSNEESEREFYNWHLKSIKAKINPVELKIKTLKSFEGSYGEKTIQLKDSQLIYTRDGEDFIMEPLGADEFKIEKMPFLRLKFSENRKEMYEIYDIGRKITNTKN